MYICMYMQNRLDIKQSEIERKNETKQKDLKHMITGSSAAVELRARTTANRTCYEYESLLASDIREKKELKQRAC